MAKWCVRFAERLVIDQEQRVDQMIAAGKQVMAEAMAEFKPDQIIAMYSSGDDSAVTTHFTMSNYGDAFVFNADTLIGLQASRRHLRSVCEANKWHLEVRGAESKGAPKRRRDGSPWRAEDCTYSGVWTEGKTAYEDYVLNWGFPGAGRQQHQRMYQRLKQRPLEQIQRELRAQGSRRLLLVSGIRADESAIRAGYQRAWAYDTPNRLWVNPFYYTTAADFAAYRDEFGIPRNPAKARCGISGECCCGTFAAENEKAALNSIEPELVAYLDDLSRRCHEIGMPWGWGENPPTWFVRRLQDKKRGQLRMFELDDGEGIATFQPMCVGCNNGRR